MWIKFFSGQVSAGFLLGPFHKLFLMYVFHGNVNDCFTSYMLFLESLRVNIFLQLSKVLHFVLAALIRAVGEL
jgi:hypothetical protein